MDKHTRSLNLPSSVDKSIGAVLQKLRADTHDELMSLSDSTPIIGSTIRQELIYKPISDKWRWWCLNQPNTTIYSNVAPQLASAMRNYKATFEPWGANKSTFGITNRVSTTTTTTITLNKNSNLSGFVGATASDVITFQNDQTLSAGDVLILSTGSVVAVRKKNSAKSYTIDIAITAPIASTTARVATKEELLVRALYYAQEKHGSYDDWFCISLLSDLGSVKAGDYAITGLSVANNTISFGAAISASENSSAAINNIVEIYPFRIPSSEDARHYCLSSHNLVAAGGEDFIIAGFMRLGYIQGHMHSYYKPTAQATNLGSVAVAVYTTQSSSTTGEPTTDGLWGKALYGKNTHGADWGVYNFIFAGKVN